MGGRNSKREEASESLGRGVVCTTGARLEEAVGRKAGVGGTRESPSTMGGRGAGPATVFEVVARGMCAAGVEAEARSCVVVMRTGAVAAGGMRTSWTRASPSATVGGGAGGMRACVAGGMLMAGARADTVAVAAGGERTVVVGLMYAGGMRVGWMRACEAV